MPSIFIENRSSSVETSVIRSKESSIPSSKKFSTPANSNSGRISFSISLGSAASGTFYIDDIKVSGDINPAPDFLQTVIVRKDSGFPQSVTDGTEIYRGADEQCVDLTANVGQMFYYAAFASDDRNNWSAPDADAQWYSGNLPVSHTEVMADTMPQKKIVDGVLLIDRNGHTYNAQGAMVK